MSGRRPYSYSSRTIPVRTQSNKQAEGVEPPFGVSPGGGLDAMARVRAVDETHSAGFAHEFDTINRASLSRFLGSRTAMSRAVLELMNESQRVGEQLCLLVL